MPDPLPKVDARSKLEGLSNFSGAGPVVDTGLGPEEAAVDGCCFLGIGDAFPVTDPRVKRDDLLFSFLVT